MMKDEVVEQVRKAREELASKSSYDLKTILADARKRQKESGQKVVSFALKPRQGS